MTQEQLALDRLLARTPKSQAAKEQGVALLASEAIPTFEMVAPIYASSCEDAFLTDLDGNRYIDLAMGFGATILGHSPEIVREAIARQLQKGWLTVMPTSEQQALAELVLTGSPCGESLIFTNSGSEATLTAMRLGRAATGKPRVGLFSGSYHGSHDYALFRDDLNSPQSRPAAKSIGSGIPDVVRDETTLMLPYHSEAAFEQIRANSHELAMVCIQAVQNNTPRLDNGEFLVKLREVCSECGVLLMFDEVVTGFRMGWTGAQGYYGVSADLATYGKIIGGGLPVGAVAGGRDVMDLLTNPGRQGVFAGGTFSGNPLTMVAGAAVLSHLKNNAEQVYPQLESEGTRLGNSINEFCANRDMAVTLMHAGSMQCMHFKRGPISNLRDAWRPNHAAERAFYVNLLERGVLIPGVHCYFLSAAHTPALVDEVIEAMKESLLACRQDGLL